MGPNSVGLRAWRNATQIRNFSNIERPPRQQGTALPAGLPGGPCHTAQEYCSALVRSYIDRRMRLVPWFEPHGKAGNQRSRDQPGPQIRPHTPADDPPALEGQDHRQETDPCRGVSLALFEVNRPVRDVGGSKILDDA